MRNIFIISILVVLSASILASVNPDGMEKVAGNLGFINKAEEHAAPMPGYSFPLIPRGALSTALAGGMGVILSYGVFCGAARFFGKR